MPADYKSLKTTPEKKPLPGFLWLLAGLTIGLFVALLVYLDRQPVNPVSFDDAIQAELDKINKKATARGRDATKSKEETQPKFNFYTILPEMEVFIPEFELKFSNTDNEPEDNATESSGKAYILQAGSFKNPQDADRLKANLTLLGLEVYLQSVTVNNQQWHRVRTGPYTNTKDLYYNLSLLKQNGINPMPLEIKPD